MHTDDTLTIFEDLTVRIGAEFRKFNNCTCPAFDTRELPRETNARNRRELKRSGAQRESDPRPSTSVSDGEAEPEPTFKSNKPLRKVLNIQTYKHHSLGDYPKMVRQFGTTDSYSTEPVRHI
jgi:hypothetical protein